MARVRQSSTAPEQAVAVKLRELGHAYRRNVRTLPGSPDFANKTRKWAIFVHGCYWHHHEGCRRATIPKTNTAFWTLKFEQNIERDRRAVAELDAVGYTVLVIWECELTDVLSEKLANFFEPRRI